MQNNNPITEIAILVIAALLIIGGALLLYFGKIDFTAATLMFGTAAGIYGVNGAFKASSPTQQAQISTQQESLQNIVTQLMSVLPLVFQHTTAPAPTQPVMQAPAQPVQSPMQPPMQPVQQWSMPAQPTAPQPLQQQFRPVQIPDVSMPYPVVKPPQQ